MAVLVQRPDTRTASNVSSAFFTRWTHKRPMAVLVQRPNIKTIPMRLTRWTHKRPMTVLVLRPRTETIPVRLTRWTRRWSPSLGPSDRWQFLFRVPIMRLVCSVLERPSSWTLSIASSKQKRPMAVLGSRPNTKTIAVRLTSGTRRTRGAAKKRTDSDACRAAPARP